MALTYELRDRVFQTSNTATTGGTVYLTGAATAGYFNFRDLYANGSVAALYLVDGTTGAFEASYGVMTYGGGGATTDSITGRTITSSSSGDGVTIAWGGGTRNAYGMIGARSFMTRENAGAEYAGREATFRTNLLFGSSATMAASRFGLIDSGLTGGTTGKVVRLTSSGTCVDASNADTIDQLAFLMLKTAEGYYLPGSYVPGLTLTALSIYYLGTAGAYTATDPGTPTSSLRRVVLGKAITAAILGFNPQVPVGG